jgi:hypothetical protein
MAIMIRDVELITWCFWYLHLGVERRVGRPVPCLTPLAPFFPSSTPPRCRGHYGNPRPQPPDPGAPPRHLLPHRHARARVPVGELGKNLSPSKLRKCQDSKEFMKACREDLSESFIFMISKKNSTMGEAIAE